MAKITVLGAGMMGSALCVPMVDRGHDVRLVGTHLDNALIDRLKIDRFHLGLKLELPRAIEPLHFRDLHGAAHDAEVFGVGVSSAGVEWVGEQLAPYVVPERPILMISKGLRWEPEQHAAFGEGGLQGSLQILPDVLRDAMQRKGAPSVEPVAVAGPCIAGELARRVDTSVVFCGRDPRAVLRLKALLDGGYYRIWTEADVVGAEMSAALKNAYAMGMAFAAGVHEARGGEAGSVALHNYEATVFAQAVHEMQLIAEAAHGNAKTVVGLAGVGDLHVTCNGGRTGRFGRLLGLGLGRTEALGRMQGATLECLEILAVLERALPALEQKLGRGRLPLLEHMMDVALRDLAVAPPFGAFFQARGDA